MRTKHDALRDAVTETHNAYQLAEDGELKDHLDRALLLLSLVQAYEEAEGDHKETISYAIEHSPGVSRE